MNTELLFFILTSAFVIAGTTIDAWHDKEVIEDFRRMDGNPNFPMYKWKTWGNFYALFTISVVITLLIALEHWWCAFMWYPIMWLLWWTVHDVTTGWFILGKPLHISSDPISQWFGRAFQQSGVVMLAWRLFWLFMLIAGYLMLSFNIKMGW
jgi:hypothetical protein